MTDIAVNTLFEIDQVVSFDETIIVDNLIKYLEPNYVDKRKDIKARAVQIVNESRKSIGIIKSPIENLLQEYQLNSEEGTVLLCLAEALLRIPDQKTIDRLLEDKFTSTDWKKHTGFDKGLFVNASSWAFFLTGNILKRETVKLGAIYKKKDGWCYYTSVHFYQQYTGNGQYGALQVSPCVQCIESKILCDNLK